MSQRVQIDTALRSFRRLLKQFDNAGTVAGTTRALPTITPAAMVAAKGFGKGRQVSMGLAGSEGMISFVHNFDPDTDIEVWEHSEMWEKIEPTSYGWCLVAESTTYNTKNVLKWARGSFKIPAGAPFYLRSVDGAVVECMVSGPEDEVNKNTDRS